jgi:hypothetical protein
MATAESHFIFWKNMNRPQHYPHQLPVSSVRIFSREVNKEVFMRGQFPKGPFVKSNNKR